jgi:hypothetical protein
MKQIQLAVGSLFVAETLWEKTRGVIRNESLLTNGLLLIPDCNWVHGFFLSCPIEVHFISEDYSLIESAELFPNSFSKPCWNAKHTIEAAHTNSSGMLQEALIYLRHHKV